MSSSKRITHKMGSMNSRRLQLLQKTTINGMLLKPNHKKKSQLKRVTMKKDLMAFKKLSKQSLLEVKSLMMVSKNLMMRNLSLKLRS